MLFHGKALEVFTTAYQNIQKIDEDEDLEVGLHLHSVLLLAWECVRALVCMGNNLKCVTQITDLLWFSSHTFSR